MCESVGVCADECMFQCMRVYVKLDVDVDVILYGRGLELDRYDARQMEPSCMNNPMAFAYNPRVQRLDMGFTETLRGSL